MVSNVDKLASVGYALVWIISLKYLESFGPHTRDRRPFVVCGMDGYVLVKDFEILLCCGELDGQISLAVIHLLACSFD